MAKKKGGCFFGFIKFVAVMLVLFVAINFGGKFALKKLYPLRYTEYIEKYCTMYHVEEKLMYAVVKCESGFDSNAVSDVGARGLTQILPDTFQWLQWKMGEELSDDMLFDAETSIKYGTYLMSVLLTEFNGETETAVAAYHAGIGVVGEWLKNSEYSADGKTLYKIPYNDTKLYVDRIKLSVTIYEKLYDV